MTRRWLPPAEWEARLVGTELETVWPYLDRVRARVLAVEVGDDLAASWAFFPALHAEGISIMPAYRGHPGIVRQLFKGLRLAAADYQLHAVWTAALTEDVVGYLQRLGARELPARHFILPV